METAAVASALPLAEESGEELCSPEQCPELQGRRGGTAVRAAAAGLAAFLALALILGPALVAAGRTPPSRRDFARSLGAGRAGGLKASLLQGLQLKAEEEEDEEKKKRVKACERKTDEKTEALFGGLTEEDFMKLAIDCGGGPETKSCKTTVATFEKEVRNSGFFRSFLHCSVDSESPKCKAANQQIKDEIAQLDKDCVKEGGKICHIVDPYAEVEEEELDCTPKECLEFVDDVTEDVEAHLEDMGNKKSVEVHCHDD